MDRPVQYIMYILSCNVTLTKTCSLYTYPPGRAYHRTNTMSISVGFRRSKSNTTYYIYNYRKGEVDIDIDILIILCGSRSAIGRRITAPGSRTYRFWPFRELVRCHIVSVETIVLSRKLFVFHFTFSKLNISRS